MVAAETIALIVTGVCFGVSEMLPFFTSVKPNGVLESMGMFASTAAKKWQAADQISMRVICKDSETQTE